MSALVSPLHCNQLLDAVDREAADEHGACARRLPGGLAPPPGGRDGDRVQPSRQGRNKSVPIPDRLCMGV